MIFHKQINAVDKQLHRGHAQTCDPVFAGFDYQSITKNLNVKLLKMDLWLKTILSRVRIPPGASR